MVDVYYSETGQYITHFSISKWVRVNWKIVSIFPWKLLKYSEPKAQKSI